MTAADPLLGSALRTLDQLSRRTREYTRLYELAGTEAAMSDREMRILRSEGEHLAGVLWARSDREFDLRVYVTNLEWEAGFYGATFKRSSRVAGETSESEPLYSEQRKQTDETSETEAHELNLSWSEPGDLLLRIEVSDFCTFNANAIWTGAALPERAEQITGPLQRVLNELDPGSNDAVDRLSE